MSAADLSACRLYGILDLGYVARAEARRVAAAMLEGGVDILQLRAKNLSLAEIATLAGELHKETSAAGAPLVINDHAEIACEVGAEGVHVGQDDLSVNEARAIAAERRFESPAVASQPLRVGKSTHSLEQAKRAVAEGADYIGWGPLFATPTKPDYLPIGLGEIE